MQVKQHLVKRQATLAKFINKLEYNKIDFLIRKNIPLKYSGVRSRFEALIKMSATVSPDFDLDARF